jgi:hypothetical protein
MFESRCQIALAVSKQACCKTLGCVASACHCAHRHMQARREEQHIVADQQQSLGTWLQLFMVASQCTHEHRPGRGMEATVHPITLHLVMRVWSLDHLFLPSEHAVGVVGSIVISGDCATLCIIARTSYNILPTAPCHAIPE